MPTDSLLGLLEALSTPWLRDRPEVRILLAGATALAATLLSGGLFIRALKRRSVLENTARGDSERLDQLHSGKSKTPTMGGVFVFGSVAVATALWGSLADRGILLVLGTTAALALIGFADDYKKLRTKKGLKARMKLRLQLLVGIAAGLWLALDPLVVVWPGGAAGGGTAIFLPFLRDHPLEVGWVFGAWVILVITASSNAVNLTDGLDGLAMGCSLLVVGVLLSLAWVAGSPVMSSWLAVPGVEGAEELCVYLAALLGAGLGFLWFNCHPAQIFMGDVGALPLGGALGLCAVLLKQELILVLAGGVLVVETLSVLLQVGSYKLRKKRIFLIAPLHHHYQFKGWPETRITLRFWLAGLICALTSLAVLRWA